MRLCMSDRFVEARVTAQGPYLPMVARWQMGLF